MTAAAKRYVAKYRCEVAAIGWSVLDKRTGEWVLIPGTKQAVTHPSLAVSEQADRDTYVTPWRYQATIHADRLNRTPTPTS